MSTLTEEQRKRIEENRKKALERRAALLKSRASTSNSGFSEVKNSLSSPGSIIDAKSIKWLDKPTFSSNQLPGSNSSSKFQPPVASSFIDDKSIKWLDKPKFPAKQNAKSDSSISGNQPPLGLQRDFNRAQTTKQNTGQSFGQNIGSSFASNSNPWKKASVDKALQSKAANFYGKPDSSDKDASGGDKPGPKEVFTGRKLNGRFSLIERDRFVVDLPYHAQSIEIFKTLPSKKYDVSTHRWSFNISDHTALSQALIPLRPAVTVCPLPNFILQALRKSTTYLPHSSIDLMSIDPLLLEAFMPFQREGVCFGVSRNGRVLIADDMGLGKTVQALGIASYYRSQWPLLIVTPSSVRYAWVEAIERWISDIDPHDIVIANSGKDCLDGTVAIMSYDLLTRRAQELKDKNFQVVIMDESHMLKNFKSQRYKAAAPIMKASSRLILLSGTPALSRPSELYTQISAVDSRLIPNFQDYGIRYCDGKMQPWGWDFSGSSNMKELQILLEATIMIRRLKSEVITQLPAKQRMTVILDPSSIKKTTKAMKEIASQLKGTSLKGMEKHGALLQYFNESAVLKSKAVCEYVKDLLIDGEKKFLVFAHHRIMMDHIAKTCQESNVSYIRIDGTTSSETRQKQVDLFQENPHTRVAVLSITAASSGITLTAAQLVVFAELYWNPGFLIQAEDRAHRIGQEDSVLVQYLVAKGTADDVIWPLVQSKLNILNKVGLSADNFSAASCTNQKVTEEEEGILKYFSPLKKEDDFPDEDFSHHHSLKRKRSSDDDEDNS